MLGDTGNGEAVLFDRRERVMISGVLQLAERPIRSIMTPRAEVDYLDLRDDADKVRLKLMHSSVSRLPLVGEGASMNRWAMCTRRNCWVSCSVAMSRT